MLMTMIFGINQEIRKDMKKILYTSIAFVAILSCAKESAVNEAVEIRTETLKAFINNEGTDNGLKSDYSISGSTATFCWKGTEQIGRLASNGSLYQNVFTSTAEANSGETELTFSGEADANALDFAVYPKKGTTAGINWYSNPFYLYLNESLTYNASSPLEGIVPMLGKLDGEGDFVFNVITGVLGVRIVHMPPSATKVRISSDTQKLCYGFRYTDTGSEVTIADELDAIYTGGLLLSSAKADAGSTKTYTFDAGLDFNTEYVFYYPIPAGTLNGITVTVLNGSTELYSKTSSKDITVTKGTISRLPLITLPSYAVTVEAGGPSTGIQAQVTDWSSGVAKVKAYAASSSAAATAGVAASGTTINTLNTSTTVAGDFSDSGEYYIAYQGYDSSDNALEGTSGVVTAYYLSASDYTKLVKTHNITSSDGNLSVGTMVIELSDDCSQGQVILSEFDGMPNTSSMSDTHRFFTSLTNNSTTWMGGNGNTSYPYSAAKVSSGDTYYGIIDGSTLTFNSDADGTTGADNTAKAFFNYSVSGSGTAKIFIYSAATGNYVTPLSFTIGSDPVLTSTAIVRIRFNGSFYNGSNINTGYAAKDYTTTEITTTD